MSLQEELEFGCDKCRDGWQDFAITMAFQPIVDVKERRILAHEALVRGINGEGAGTVLSRVDGENIHAFDQLCRATAIKTAAGHGIDCHLSINFLPNAVYNPINCLRTTLAAARLYGIPKERLILEVTESEEIIDRAHLADIIHEYQKLGISVAIDDFGAGHSGLNLLAVVRPDIVKLDRFLITDIDQSTRKQAIVHALIGLCETLDIKVVCEGIETAAEFQLLRGLGVHLFQGYYFARPAFEGLAPVDFDALQPARSPSDPCGE